MTKNLQTRTDTCSIASLPPLARRRSCLPERGTRFMPDRRGQSCTPTTRHRTIPLLAYRLLNLRRNEQLTGRETRPSHVLDIIKSQYLLFLQIHLRAKYFCHHRGHCFCCCTSAEAAMATATEVEVAKRAVSNSAIATVAFHRRRLAATIGAHTAAYA